MSCNCFPKYLKCIFRQWIKNYHWIISVFMWCRNYSKYQWKFNIIFLWSRTLCENKIKSQQFRVKIIYTTILQSKIRRECSRKRASLKFYIALARLFIAEENVVQLSRLKSIVKILIILWHLEDYSLKFVNYFLIFSVNHIS